MYQYSKLELVACFNNLISAKVILLIYFKQPKPVSCSTDAPTSSHQAFS